MQNPSCQSIFIMLHVYFTCAVCKLLAQNNNNNNNSNNNNSDNTYMGMWQ